MNGATCGHYHNFSASATVIHELSITHKLRPQQKPEFNVREP